MPYPDGFFPWDIVNLPPIDALTPIVIANINPVRDMVRVLEADKMNAYGLYGDGSDGDVTIPAGATVTLTRDMFYRTLKLTYPNAKLRTNGFRVFCSRYLEMLGNVDDQENNQRIGNWGEDGEGGDDTMGGLPGASGAGNYLPAPPPARAGANGGMFDGVAGQAGAPELVSWGGSNGLPGALGGLTIAHSGGPGGAGGTATQMPASYGSPRCLMNAMLWRTFSPTGVATRWGYHAGNGGAGSGAWNGTLPGAAGGGGGGNGGMVLIAAREIYAGGWIDARGGNGGTGAGQLGFACGGGGGAGGNGGMIIILSDRLQLADMQNQLNVSGGTGGAGGIGEDAFANPGETGPAGRNGLAIWLSPQLT